jgi:branched-chain amino acid transport system ATP-binding protein
MNAPALRVRGLCVSYGAIEAVKSIELEVRLGELVALIGANGAGKTTSLKAIAGLLPWSGSIELFGREIHGAPAYQLLGQGLALVPEGRGLFARMTVEENLQMGAFTRRDAQVAEDFDKMYESFPRLKERARQLAGTLSGGEQQMLAMARALMSRPKLLLLDEPSMGLSPILVERIFEVIREVSQRGISILLVEQNARLALEIAHRGYVMESGQLSLSGAAASLLHDARVREAYLGESS